MNQEYWVKRNISKAKWFFNSEDEDASNFASRFIYERKKRNLLQTEIAELLGITQPQVSALESGRIQPIPKLVFKFEEVLGLEDGVLSKCLGYERVAS